MVPGVIRIVFGDEEPSLVGLFLGIRLMAYIHLLPDTNGSLT